MIIIKLIINTTILITLIINNIKFVEAKCNVVKTLIPYGLRMSRITFAQIQIKFRAFFLKMLTLDC